MTCERQLAGLLFSWLTFGSMAAGNMTAGAAAEDEPHLAAERTPNRAGDMVIRSHFAGSPIQLTTTRRLAGAVHSLRWNGREFIDSSDHGRQLQSAANFDVGSRFISETFNPTEAGSRHDGAGPTSTSRLLHATFTKNSLQTTTQMAFWLRPGERSNGHLAKNRQSLSQHLVTKRITIGWNQLPNVIAYDVTFSTPVGEFHRYAQFEAVTGYMPAEFSQFWRFDPQTLQLQPLSDGPGEQREPVVFSTVDGAYAMGIYSPDQPSQGFEQAGYGRFRFRPQQVVKWNCVFRIRNADGVPPGEYHFRSRIVIGDLKTVTATMAELHAMPQAGQ